MKNILVPCDFSIPSFEAYKFAMEYASETGGMVKVLHAINVAAMYVPNMEGGGPLAYEPTFLSVLEDDARKRMDTMRASVPQDIPSTLDIWYGDIVTCIRQAIDEKKADLVIIGTSGAGGPGEIFAGSTTEKIIRNSSIPVVVIRKAPTFASISKILVPTALNEDEAGFMMQVKKFQKIFDAEIHLLLVNTPTHFISDDEARKRFNEFVNENSLKGFSLHFRNYLSEEDGIADFASEEKMDMVMMGTHGRKGLSHLFIGSITEDVLHRVPCPLVTCKLENVLRETETA